MIPFEMRTFKEKITDPTLDVLLEKTKLNDGLCYIDNLEIIFTDKRNWGHVCHMKASGLLYKKNDVHEFLYEASDIDMGILARETMGCFYLLEGKLRFYDNCLNLEIKTDIKNMDLCGKLYPELHAVKDLSLTSMNLEWVKLNQLYQEKKDKKPSLEQTLKEAQKAQGTAIKTDTPIHKRNEDRRI